MRPLDICARAALLVVLFVGGPALLPGESSRRLEVLAARPDAIRGRAIVDVRLVVGGHGARAWGYSEPHIDVERHGDGGWEGPPGGTCGTGLVELYLAPGTRHRDSLLLDSYELYRLRIDLRESWPWRAEQTLRSDPFRPCDHFGRR